MAGDSITEFPAGQASCVNMDFPPFSPGFPVSFQAGVEPNSCLLLGLFSHWMTRTVSDSIILRTILGPYQEEVLHFLPLF